MLAQGDLFMNALIVAAGTATRLRPLTENLPKPLIDFWGQTLLGRSVSLLKRAGITSVTVVVGYLQESIRSHLGDEVTYIHNPFFANTNNLASCWFGLSSMPVEPVLYLHGDLVYHPNLLGRMLDQIPNEGMKLLVDFDSVDEEAMKVRIEHGKFTESSKLIPLSEAAGEWTGIATLSGPGMDRLRKVMGEVLSEGTYSTYDTEAFNRLAAQGFSFELTPTEGLPWCEIDTVTDLEKARNLFRPEEAK